MEKGISSKIKKKPTKVKRSMFSKIVFTITLILLVSFIFLGWIISKIVKDELEEQYMSSFKQKIESESKYVEFLINEIEKESAQVLLDNDLIDILSFYPETEQEIKEGEVEIEKFLYKVMLKNSFLESVYIINPDKMSSGSPYIYPYKDRIKEITETDYYERITDISKEPSGMLWTSPHINLLSEEENVVISNIRILKNLYTFEDLGVLFLNIKPDLLIQKNNSNDLEQEIFIFGRGNKLIISHSALENIGKPATDFINTREIEKQIIEFEKNREGDSKGFGNNVLYNKDSAKKFGYFYYSESTQMIYVNIIPYSKLTEASERILKVLIMICIVVLILIVVATSIVSMRITKPIREILIFVKGLSMGNFERRIFNKNNDEITEISKELNITLDKLTVVINDINNENENILKISEDVSDKNSTLMLRVSDEASSVIEIATATNEITEIMNNNLKKVVTLNSLIKNTKEMVKATETESYELNDAIYAIKKSSNTIREIVEIIEEIAFQTNILSLNTSIEAARAGEEGKGFSVIASEVRDLSKRTNKFANKITQLIESNDDKIRKGGESVEKTLSNMNNIKEGVTKVSFFVAEIDSSIKEQVYGVNQVNNSLGNLEEIAQQNSNVSEDILKMTKSLNIDVIELSKRMAYFKLKKDD